MATQLKQQLSPKVEWEPFLSSPLSRSLQKKESRLFAPCFVFSTCSFHSQAKEQSENMFINQKHIYLLNVLPLITRSLFISTKFFDITWNRLSGFTEKINTVNYQNKNYIQSSKLLRLYSSTVTNKKQAKTSTMVPKSLIKKSSHQSFANRGSNKRIATLPKNTNLFCLISINRTKNNTHAVISNLFGENKTKWSISAGQLKLPGGRRKTRLSQRMVYKSCLEKALSFGYKFTVIHCRGTRGSKTRIFRFFGNFLSVLLIKDITGTPHNGCRPPKVRRV